jgi:hypothetical protein
MPDKPLSGFRITYRNKINLTVLITIDKKMAMISENKQGFKS